MYWNNHITNGDGLTICFMSHDNTPDNTLGEANANLIAAAPDLLANCINALAYIEACGVLDAQSGTAADLREAIAKALDVPIGELWRANQ